MPVHIWSRGCLYGSTTSTANVCTLIALSKQYGAPVDLINAAPYLNRPLT